MLPFAQVTPEQLAAQLEAEADGLEASADPVVQAAGRRIRLVAEFALQLVDPRTTGMLVSERMDQQIRSELRAELGKQYSKAKGLELSPIAAAAHKAGLSFRALAAACEIPHSYLSQMAKGARPVSSRVVRKVAELTGWNDWPRRDESAK